MVWVRIGVRIKVSDRIKVSVRIKVIKLLGLRFDLA